MDLENQKRVKELAEQHGTDNIIVLIGGSDAEACGLAVETVMAGDPAFAGALTGVQLGLSAYHIIEPEIKALIDPSVYEENIGMMEMVLDVDAIIEEVSTIRKDCS